MFEFFSTFPKTPAILPVIHVLLGSSSGVEHAITNAHICADQHADGVFLIDHYGRPLSFLMEVARAVREKLPDLWIGANSLNTPSTEGYESFMRYDLQARWIDTLGIEDHGGQAGLIRVASESFGYHGLLFGGVAFKYVNPGISHHMLQAHTKIAIEALGPTGVITTSGQATGQPPELEKLVAIRRVIGEAPLAVASGISPENVAQYVPLVDAILVSSSLTDKDDNFIPRRLKQLLTAAGR